MTCHSKRCSKCGEVKPLSAFYRDRKKKDGRRSDCTECFKNAKRQARKEKMKDPIFRERARLYSAKRRKLAPWKTLNIYKTAKKRLIAAGYNLDGCCVHHWNYNNLHQVIICHEDAHKLLHQRIILMDNGLFKRKNFECNLAVYHFGLLGVIYRELGYKDWPIYVNLKYL